MVITYPNGSVPPGMLASLEGQPEAQLRVDAAKSWNRARASTFLRTGITLFVRGWNRTLAEQERFFFERYAPQATGTGPFDDVRWYKGVRYVRVLGAAAAIPGTSNHGWGIAVDVDDYGAVGNFNHPRRVATFPILAEYGWTDTEGRGSIQEPWHLVYDPTRDKHINDPEDPMPTADEIRAIVRTEIDRDRPNRRTDAYNAIWVFPQWTVPGTERKETPGQFLSATRLAAVQAVHAAGQAAGIAEADISRLIAALPALSAADIAAQLTVTTKDPA